MSESSLIDSRSGNRWLVAGALAGAILWSLHLVVSYSLAEVACRFNLLGSRLLGLSLLVILVLLATLAAAAATAYAAWATYRAWQAVKRRQQQGQPINRTRLFILRVGTYMNILFLIVILLSGLPAPFLSPCA